MGKKIKLMVSGSRGITDKTLIFNCLDEIYKKKQFDVLIQGGARGVDRIAKEWALSTKKIELVKTYKANWKKYGKYAGLKRNTDMVADCDFGIVIWDGYSKGTKDALAKLIKADKLFGQFMLCPKCRDEMK